MEGGPINLLDATARADSVMARLSPFCVQRDGKAFIAVVGEVRRKITHNIPFIEIVAAPNTRDMKSMQDLREVVNNFWGTPTSGAFPGTPTVLRKLTKMNIYWTSAEQFGFALFWRTGSPPFIQRAETFFAQKRAGVMSEEGMYVEGIKLLCPAEDTVFEHLKVKFVKPEKRV